MNALWIADESDLVTGSARLVLEGAGEWAIAGEAHRLVDLERGLPLQPASVVIYGDRLEPSLDALTLLGRVRTTAPGARAIALGSSVDGLLLVDLFAHGLHAYLYRGDRLSGLLAHAVRMVLSDRPYLSPTANTDYLLALQRGQGLHLDAEARQVLQRLAQGEHVGEIALALNLPPRRVYSIRQKLRHRFGATTNEHLISRAALEGFIAATE